MFREFCIFIIFILISCFSMFSQWERADNGLPQGERVLTMACDNNSNVVVQLTDYQLYLSSDNGLNWKKVNQTPTTSMFNVTLAIDNNYILFGLDETPPGYISSDYGQTWQPLSQSLTSHISNIFSAAIYDGNFYVGTHMGAWISRDSGKNWAPLMYKSDWLMEIISNFLLYSDKIIASGWNAGFLFSPDSGSTWTGINNGLPANGDKSDKIVKLKDMYITSIFDKDNGGIYVLDSINGVWRPILKTSQKDSITCWARHPQILNNEIFALAKIPGSTGIIYSKDNGNSWHLINNGIEFLFDTLLIPYGAKTFGLLSANGKYLFFCPDRDFSKGAIFRIKSTDLGIVLPNDVKDIPDNYSFSISPNPVESFISLNIPFEYQTSQIKIYSIEGIELLTTEYKDKIDVSGFAPGVYYLMIGDKVVKFVKI